MRLSDEQFALTITTPMKKECQRHYSRLADDVERLIDEDAGDLFFFTALFTSH